MFFMVCMSCVCGGVYESDDAVVFVVVCMICCVCVLQVKHATSEGHVWTTRAAIRRRCAVSRTCTSTTTPASVSMVSTQF